MTNLTISNVSSPGKWAVQASLIGNASLSRRGGTSSSGSSGGGGWQIVDRARQKAATEWLDYYPWVMSCQCIIDINIEGGTAGSIEGWITTLESFELPVFGSAPPLPPILTVAGPVPHTDLFWVCTRLDFPGGEDGTIRNTAGERTQQAFTIELTEYSPSSAVVSQSLSPAQIVALGFGSAATGTTITTASVANCSQYTVVSGDTLQSIAAAKLKNTSLWTQIALLNGLSNSALLFAGQVLWIPNSA